MGLPERIDTITTEQGITDAELARVAGLESRGSVSQWRVTKTGAAIKSMGYKYAYKINRKYGYAIHWLITGEGPKKDTDIIDIKNTSEKIILSDEERHMVRHHRQMKNMEESSTKSVLTKQFNNWLGSMDELFPQASPNVRPPLGGGTTKPKGPKPRPPSAPAEKKERRKK